MAEKNVRLRGVAALSIATVGLAMGAIPAADAQADSAAATTSSSCNDFVVAFNKIGGAFLKFLKADTAFQKVENVTAAQPFLKFEGAQTGFMKYESNIASFYKVQTGGVDIFLKDALDDTNLPAVQYCISDGNGVSRGFFSKATDYDGDTTLAGAHVSFLKVDSKQAFFKVELQAVTISTYIMVDKDGKTVAAIDEVSNSETIN